MEKSLFQSILNKYYLKNTIPTTKWNIKSNVLDIGFMAPSNEMIGKLQFKNFPLEDSQFVIYDTEQLLKLINILDKTIDLSLIKNGNLALKLNIKDDKFKQTYFLSDLMLAPKVGKLKDIGDFDVDVDISDHYANLVKAKDALSGSNRVTFKIERNLLKFIFGDNNNFSNKVEYEITLNNIPPSKVEMPLNSDIFKEIIVNNKDLTHGRLSINYKGLVRLEFANDDKSFTTQYNVLRIAD